MGLCDAGFLCEKDMAKQNNDQGFADETQQNKKTKESAQKETENKPKQGKKQNKKQGKHQKKKHRKNRKINLNVAIWLMPVIIFLIIIYYSRKTYLWSIEMGKSSIFIGFIADNVIAVITVFIALLSIICAIICKAKRKNIWACVTVTCFMVIILCMLCAANAKVVASVRAGDELIAASIEKSANFLGYIQNQAVYQLRQYIPEEDLFMEYLEQYCSIPDNDISQEERPGIMADIILLCLKNNITITSEKKLPYNYETNVLMGNVMYNSFSDLKGESEKAENDSIKNRICDYALNTLDEAINCRIEADNSLHTAENRRLIGVYNIDAGDCHQSVGEIDSAAVCYEDAAEWAVKSIYSAAIENDVQAMEDAWNVLNNAADKLEEVEGSSDGDNVQKIKDIRDAYKIVIDQWE